WSAEGEGIERVLAHPSGPLSRHRANDRGRVEPARKAHAHGHVAAEPEPHAILEEGSEAFGRIGRRRPVLLGKGPVAPDLKLPARVDRETAPRRDVFDALVEGFDR